MSHDHSIFVLAAPESWSTIARAVVLVKDFKIIPGFYTGGRDAGRFVAVTEKESRQKVWEIVGIIWRTMSDIQGDSWRTSAAVEFCGNFLHVTDGVLKIVWEEGSIITILRRISMIYLGIFFHNQYFYMHRKFCNDEINNVVFDMFFCIIAFENFLAMVFLSYL